MLIATSQPGISLGKFIPDAETGTTPMIRIMSPMKADLVIPKLKIDSSVLFQPVAAALQGQAVQGELDKVAQFVRSFSPSKLIVEGHTDSDGDDEANQALSELRAGMIKDYLINNYEEITPDMVDAQGYGETRPIVTNDTPENMALNRRIEIVVWE
jgi:OOP family OmpA-OmpF porin